MEYKIIFKNNALSQIFNYEILQSLFYVSLFNQEFNK